MCLQTQNLWFWVTEKPLGTLVARFFSCSASPNYDTMQYTPGAADAMTPVAAMLETIRFHAHNNNLANNLHFLVTVMGLADYRHDSFANILVILFGYRQFIPVNFFPKQRFFDHPGFRCISC